MLEGSAKGLFVIIENIAKMLSRHENVKPV